MYVHQFRSKADCNVLGSLVGHAVEVVVVVVAAVVDAMRSDFVLFSTYRPLLLNIAWP